MPLVRNPSTRVSYEIIEVRVITTRLVGHVQTLDIVLSDISNNFCLCDQLQFMAGEKRNNQRYLCTHAVTVKFCKFSTIGNILLVQDERVT